MFTNKSVSEVFREKIEEFYSKNRRSIRKNDFDIFHFSAQQKLWQSDYYFQRIMDIYNSQRFEADYMNVINVPTTDYGGVTESSTMKYEIDKVKLARYCNLYIDGYFSSVSSIFDSLLHEVNVVFKLVDPEKDIYWHTMLDEFQNACSNSEFYKFLIKRKPKRWWQTLDSFRNALTHESVIATNIDTSTDVLSGTEKLQRIPLPDDPKKRPFTYQKGRELKDFIEKFNEKVLPVLEQCYKKIFRDLKKSGKLPIKV